MQLVALLYSCTEEYNYYLYCLREKFEMIISELNRYGNFQTSFFIFSSTLISFKYMYNLVHK
jgi:hypothetical protein